MPGNAMIYHPITALEVVEFNTHEAFSAAIALTHTLYVDTHLRHTWSRRYTRLLPNLLPPASNPYISLQ